MATRIRGQEITVRFFANGIPLTGGFLKVTEFTATPRVDLNEEDFLGEQTTDIDTQHNGWDFSFTTHVTDAAGINFLTNLVTFEANQVTPQEITVNVTRKFRDPLAVPSIITEVYYNAQMKPNEDGFSGRKDYVTTSYEGKAKSRLITVG